MDLYSELSYMDLSFKKKQAGAELYINIPVS